MKTKIWYDIVGIFPPYEISYWEVKAIGGLESCNACMLDSQSQPNFQKVGHLCK